MHGLFEVGFWLRVVFAIICGLIIGLERQIRGKPVGIRTCILICLGTAFFIYLSIQINGSENISRVLGQVVTGVGFLGAGVIMTKGDIVSGVTSAAVVWLLAAIGAAVGLEFYGLSLAVAIIAVAVLVGVELLEKAFKFLRQGAYKYRQQ